MLAAVSGICSRHFPLTFKSWRSKITVCGSATLITLRSISAGWRAAPIVLSDSEPHDDRYAAMISSRLKERGIVTAHRSGSVRTSPHFYISPGEIDRMISELP